MVSKELVKNELDKANLAFEKCWLYLCEIKTGKVSKDNLSCLVDFQPRLAESLFNLGRLYREIEQQKKSLISRKEKLNQNWFRNRMGSLSKYQKTINQAISIGKGIGDAFAWFFYQRDRQYLTEHLSQDEIFHFPPGFGGIGELEFVKNIRILHGYFILYHGTTNILRLGDISLIDLENFSVAGVGEIKTDTPVGETLKISLIFSGPGICKEKIEKSDLSNGVVRQQQETFLNGFPQKAKDRFERQVKRITKSFDKLSVIPDSKISFESHSNIERLDSLFDHVKTGKFTFKILSEGLAIGVYKVTTKKFSNNLLKYLNYDLSDKIVGVEKYAMELFLPERTDNSLIVDSLYYDEDGNTSHLPGMSHLFWWPLKLETIRKIMFQEAIVITLYNPSHLINKFELSGFTVNYEAQQKYIAYKSDSEKEFAIEGFSYYMRMIYQYLFNEESIINIIYEMEQKINKLQLNTSTRIDMNIEQKFGNEKI
ncbi:hypothetical protein [Candidatus Methylobacter oryzae]|uniref:Uncharacterized protein n=1 Tax=Candidatus Methylobacter oryzae TaxID=2497749 RepID=A0ABY3CE03_9GAMM|nr:hypothetical protein [Candidatus Methylobacter oryzae]TRX01144.1 hypothetical protein EKO24_004245 [Candidatus Methylobacter oryzae]